MSVVAERATADEVVEAESTVGPGRLHYNFAKGRRKGTVVLGHGAGGGIETIDLLALSLSLPLRGYEVVRVEQPWRLAGRKVAPRPEVLDRAWSDLLSSEEFLERRHEHLVVGGRSAGARVAARTASVLHAHGVVALAFPLHPPGKPERSRRDELPKSLPTLVVQGERDAFGRPQEFVATAKTLDLFVIPAADHSFAVGRAAPITQEEVGELISDYVREWLVHASLVLSAESGESASSQGR
jgi:predicted alpha/beta-hydrolase family hydrolase